MAASLFFFTGTSQAAAPGSAGFAFLNISPFARSAGMADVASSYVGDAFSVYANPAGLAHLQERSVSFGHVSHFQGVAYDQLTYVAPYGRGGLGASLGNMRYSDIPRTRFDPTATADGADHYVQSGDVEAGDYAATVSWGFRHDNNLALGANFKLIREKLDSESSVAAAVDAGGVYRFPLHRRWRASAVLQNVGYATKFVSKAPDLPTKLRGGVFYSPEPWAQWSGEAVYNMRGEPEAAVGAEFNWQQMAFLRAGYRYWFRDTELGGMTGFSLGVGVRTGPFGLDYAFLPFGDLGDSHRLSLSWMFGGAKAAKGSALRDLQRPLAVSEFHTENVSDEDALTAVGYMRMELERCSPFRVMNLYAMRGALAQNSISTAACPSADCAVRMGSVLNVEKMVVGSLARRDDRFFITSDLVDVNSGRVEKQESMEVSSSDQLPRAFRDLAQRFFPPVVR